MVGINFGYLRNFSPRLLDTFIYLKKKSLSKIISNIELSKIGDNPPTCHIKLKKTVPTVLHSCGNWAVVFLLLLQYKFRSS